VGAAGDFFIGSGPGDLERAIERDRSGINLTISLRIALRGPSAAPDLWGLGRAPLSKKVAH